MHRRTVTAPSEPCFPECFSIRSVGHHRRQTRVGTAPMSSIERHVEGRARPTDRPKGAAVSPSCECSSSSAKVRVFIEAGFVVTVWFPHPRSGKKSASQLVHGAGKEMSFRPSQVKPMAEPVT
ncbi:hypothetical protein RJ55_02097 [Drechmeria coniospora]|nr:hypothetical protein RJ55_02097 [Drechmeria coniospora]